MQRNRVFVAALAIVSTSPFAQKSVSDCEMELGEKASDRAAVSQCMLDAAPPPKPEPPRPKPKPFKSNPAEARAAIARAKTVVADEMKDPGSAQFRGVFTYRDLMVCGEVNAKNAFGGYVGFKRFVSFLSVVTFDDGSAAFSERWLRDCKGYSQQEIDAAKAALGK